MKLSLLALLSLLLLPVTAFAQKDAVDLTKSFVAGGVKIDRLVVLQIGDIVLIRGRTDSIVEAARASRFAAAQGYLRVANMIVIVPALSDAGIERLARYQLEMSPELEGCRLHVYVIRGVLMLSGQVFEDFQNGLALGLLKKIDGVHEVRSVVTLTSAKKEDGVDD